MYTSVLGKQGVNSVTIDSQLVHINVLENLFDFFSACILDKQLSENGC